MNSTINDIKKYLINEFEMTEEAAEEEINENEIGLAVSYFDAQASIDIKSNILILESGDIIKYIPVKDVNNYLDYGLLAAMLDDLLEMQGML